MTIRVKYYILEGRLNAPLFFMVKYMNPIVVFFYDNGLHRAFQKVLSLMGDLIVFLRGYPIARAIAHTSAVSGFYTLGGQMALVTSSETGAAAAAFFIAKFPGGILAFTVAAISEK